MRIEFQPLPGLTFITAIMLAILLAMGTWQYQRLQWKTKLIADIDRAANASPLRSISEINTLLSQGHPIDFRRISITGEFGTLSEGRGQGFHLIRPYEKGLAWRLFQPFISQGGGVYVATHFFAQDEKDTPPEGLSGLSEVNGYVRLPQKPNRFTPDSSPDANRWFRFNGAPEILNWADGVDGRTLQTAYYIERAQDAGAADTLPVRQPEIRNHHLDYMLTWYSFALILLIIYFILHAKRGRLRLRRD